MKIFLLLTNSIYASLLFKNETDKDLIIHTKYGKIAGFYNSPNATYEKFPTLRELVLGDDSQRIHENINKTWGRAFLGIPFAEPPVENLRFKAPISWNSTFDKFQNESQKHMALDGTNQKPACIQGSIFAPRGMDEDCLYLNVFLPPASKMEKWKKKNPQKGMPVFFYIFGGAFFFGSSGFYDFYDGGYLTYNKDIILVVPNSRVGPFGFLVASNTSLEGNYGYNDIKAALNWVIENIESFGGDPNEITVAGLSSGASMTSYIAFDETAPLVKKYIMFSNPWTLYAKPFGTAQLIGDQVISNLKCENKNYEDCLRNASAESIQSASVKKYFMLSSKEGRPIGDPLIFLPIDDGKSIKGRPFDLISNPTPSLKQRLEKINIITGTVKDELDFFFIPATFNGFLPGTILRSIPENWDGLINNFNISSFLTLLSNWTKESAARVTGNVQDLHIKQYNETVSILFKKNPEEAEKIIEKYPGSSDSKSNMNLLSRIMTLYMFTCSNNRFLSLATNYVKTIFSYQNTHVSSAFSFLKIGPNGTRLNISTVPHAFDL
jgi:carboxylesterase type B